MTPPPHILRVLLPALPSLLQPPPYTFKIPKLSFMKTKVFGPWCLLLAACRSSGDSGACGGSASGNRGGGGWSSRLVFSVRYCKVFPSREDLLEWVRRVAYRLGFVIVIIRSDIANGKQGTKTYVLLGCERGGSYRKYKDGLEVPVTGTRKFQCPFKLRGKPIGKGQGWVLKVICGTHNHDLYDTLVGNPYAGKLKAN
ncbi:uncharacterized protein [Phaseolus vulgaris]|uniref:uncharacterized protein n=1 Tax=Phaseolus vulgaris TaxID=3885 RepID=UPI0035CABB30